MDRIKLLVVDDDRSIRMALTMSLENDYLVFTAKDGREGIQLVSEQEPDLVLLDIALPDRSGIEVLKLIKELYPRIAVVIMTAVEDPRMAVRALKFGAHDYLTKPIGSRELKLALKNALEMRDGVSISGNS